MIHYQVEQIDNAKPGLMLHGFPEPPPLDVRINWTEMYNTSLPAKFQKVCFHFVFSMFLEFWSKVWL